VKVLPRGVILPGDARSVVADLLPESVDCVISSPPYYRLRDYGQAGQIGLEKTIAEYVDEIAAVMAEVRRVLKPTGSAWINLGDSYARSGGVGVPPGGLSLVPQRVALALSASGWIVRNVVVWHKPNPLPQSARDRLSPTYEVIIFATKSRRYLFDLNRIRQPHRSAARAGKGTRGKLYQGGNSGLARLKAAGMVGNPRGKNPGDVWSVATAVDRLGHQATYPEQLIERPLLATCPEMICVQCDRPWVRPSRILSVHTDEGVRHRQVVGDLARCDCFAPTRPGVVLDPFFGTGTTGAVAERLGRDWLGIELNPAYRVLAEQRLAQARRAA